MRECLIGAQERLGNAQNRPLRVEAAEFEALIRFDVKPFEKVLQSHRCEHDAVIGQVIGERRRRVEEERQIVLDTAMCDAVRYLAIDARLARLAFETLPIATPKTAHGVCVERHFARRKNADRVDALS